VLDEVRQILFGKDVHSVAAPEFLRGSFKLTDNPTYQNYPSRSAVLVAVSLNEPRRNSAPDRMHVLADRILPHLVEHEDQP